MNLFADIGQWWNLIYVVPFGLGALLTLLSVLGGSRHGGHAGHGGAVHTASGHLGGAGSHAGGAGGHAGGSHAHTGGSHGHAAAHGHTVARSSSPTHSGGRHDAHAHSDRSGFSLASSLHVQNIPPLMIAQNLLLFWGIAGWAANQVLGHGGANPGGVIVWSLPIATVCSLALTIALTATLARFTPGDETFAVSKIGLEGRPGEAVSPITEKSGWVYARDDNGTLHHLLCRVRAGAEPIKKGEPVLVCEYSGEGDFYWVKRWSPEEEAERGGTLPRAVTDDTAMPRQGASGESRLEEQ